MKSRSVQVDSNGWFRIDWTGEVPSALYDPKDDKDVNFTYTIIFGAPSKELFQQSKVEAYEKIRVRATVYLKQLGPQVSFIYGGIFRDDENGQKLIDMANSAMTPLYLKPNSNGSNCFCV